MGDAQELRAGVNLDHADRALEDPQTQAVEQDARAARVVDEQVAVFEVSGELFDGGVEVVIPAVLVDVVIGQPGGVDVGVRPLLVEHGHESLGPGERHREPGR